MKGSRGEGLCYEIDVLVVMKALVMKGHFAAVLCWQRNGDGGGVRGGLESIGD